MKRPAVAMLNFIRSKKMKRTSNVELDHEGNAWHVMLIGVNCPKMAKRRYTTCCCENDVGVASSGPAFSVIPVYFLTAHLFSCCLVTTNGWTTSRTSSIKMRVIIALKYGCNFYILDAIWYGPLSIMLRDLFKCVHLLCYGVFSSRFACPVS